MDRPLGVPAVFDRCAGCPWTVGVEEARRWAEQDPAVIAGRFRVDVARCAVAAGRVAFPEPVGERVAYEDL